MATIQSTWVFASVLITAQLRLNAVFRSRGEKTDRQLNWVKVTTGDHIVKLPTNICVTLFFCDACQPPPHSHTQQPKCMRQLTSFNFLCQLNGLSFWCFEVFFLLVALATRSVFVGPVCCKQLQSALTSSLSRLRFFTFRNESRVANARSWAQPFSLRSFLSHTHIHILRRPFGLQSSGLVWID